MAWHYALRRTEGEKLTWQPVPPILAEPISFKLCEGQTALVAGAWGEMLEDGLPGPKIRWAVAYHYHTSGGEDAKLVNKKRGWTLFLRYRPGEV